MEVKCKKCEHILAQTAKFCDKCGTPSSQKFIEELFVNKDLTEIQGHLEFLGYVCELSGDSPKQHLLIARHPNKENLIVTSSAENVIFFSSRWNGLKEVNSIDQYKFIKNLVMGSTLSQIVIDSENDLAIYGTYLGEYSKTRFGLFLELFSADIQRILFNEDFKKLLIK